MEKKFCLSNYIWTEEDGEMITKEKVREFIKIFLEICDNKGERWVRGEIRELAGDGLM
jgi:hypothetical protein